MSCARYRFKLRKKLTFNPGLVGSQSLWPMASHRIAGNLKDSDALLNFEAVYCTHVYGYVSVVFGKKHI